jgi:hypothetical protein
MIRKYFPFKNEDIAMIERLLSSYDQFFAQVDTWFHSTDLLTQYVIIIVSGIVVLLLSMIMVFSRMSK